MRGGAFRASSSRVARAGPLDPDIPARFSAHQVRRHQSSTSARSIPLDLVETETGLRARGHFYLEEPTAKKVFSQLQRKALSEWSFAYRVRQSKPLPNGGRELLAIDIIGIGPCLAGVGDTATIAVKADAARAASPVAAERAQLGDRPAAPRESRSTAAP